MRLAAILLLVACSATPTPPSNASTGSGAEPAEKPTPSSVLPPIETACATDDDCDHAWTYELDGKCCDGTCSPPPASRTWIVKVAAICGRVGHADDCPVKKCAAPAPIGCIDGQCRTR